MDRLIYTSMTGAKHAFMRQAGVAHNLANAATSGYRSQEHHFRAVPVQGEGFATRTFTVDASVKDVMDQGPMMYTGRSLDVAVQGKGWIAVQGADGKEAYTRAGSLDVNANGQLQTKDGQNVLGEGGPISIPPDSSISVAPDGTISVVPTFGVPNTTNIVARMKLVNPPEDQLERGADGLFRQKNGQPANLDANVRLAPETLEGSNVNVVDAMVNMISIARQFDMQMKMLQNADANAKAAGQLLTAAR
ncbi:MULTISPECIES: flagellar basal-body rod protein FlgF [Azospira]|uniref:Flagellar basal-body rod protein FlgF n=1 Tax=Azospira oryzae (strain ATCC BAA-33 / DSM 13638 / PS) TaxID=640081 RepID=G8QG48_AZOOP|nr:MULTISPECIES: flagellar basal-body rod protein FlgF [Azospira]AEV26121.1 flagellar basal-body rod protein FlgF [Azospira oryzae PS]MDK9690403.1 flagellar basal-body rod protein FlgF [Azospira sp.]